MAVEFTPHPAQQKIFDSKARYIGALAGIRGGKTTAGAVWLCSRIFADYKAGKRGDYLIVAPTIKILEQSTLPKFKEYFPADWGVYKDKKGSFDLIWCRKDSKEPCRIFVRSMDDPNSIEGMEALAIWGDEVGQMKGEAWPNLVGRVSITQGPILMTSTPYAMNWFYTEVYKKWKEGNPNFEVIAWSSKDNPAFPLAEYENARTILPPQIFERRYNGKFTRMEGLVYPEFDEDRHVVDPFPIPSKGLIFGGMDFGRNNPNAIVCIWEDPETKVYYVYKEFYRSEVLLQEMASFLKSEGMAYVLADTQAAQLIAELQQFYQVRGVKEADKGIEVGIERIRTLLIEDRLKFFKNKTPRTLDEIKHYHYANQTYEKNASDKPIAKDNHAMDALRYAFSRPLQGLYSGRTPFNKKNLYSAKRRNIIFDVDPNTGY